MKRITVEFFAALREQSGSQSEVFETRASTAGSLYKELVDRFGFTLKPGDLRVAVNDEFADWDRVLTDGDKLVFIPPVSGG